MSQKTTEFDFSAIPPLTFSTPQNFSSNSDEILTDGINDKIIPDHAYIGMCHE